jgi:transcriptional regulator with XRE-family HTH domain
MKVPSSMAVGQAIRALRERSRQSVSQVSRSAEISNAELTSIEAGRARPSIAVLHRVAAALGSTLVNLVHDASPHNGSARTEQALGKNELGLPDIARAIAELPANLGSKVDAAEGAAVLYAMQVSGENQSAAARLLGMERKAFVRRLVRARRVKKRRSAR